MQFWIIFYQTKKGRTENMWLFLCTLCLLSFATVAEEKADQERETQKTAADLRTSIFKKYNPKLLPVKYPKTSIRVSVTLEPKSIRNFDEENRILLLDAYLHMRWEDDYIKWSPRSYQGVKKLVVPSSDIWTPDLSAIIGDPGGKAEKSSNALLYNSGDVVWGPLMTISTYCSMNTSVDPEDSQACYIRLHSRYHDSSSLELSPHSPDVDLRTFHNSSDWSLISLTVSKHSKVTLPCCTEEQHSEIEYEVTLKREHTTVEHIVERVSLYAVFLCLIMFWLPPDSVHKVLLGALSEMMLAFGNFYLGSSLRSPVQQRTATNRTYPLMCFVAAAICAEIFVINMARMLVHCRPSRCLLGIAKCCCQPFCVCASGPYSKRDIRVLSLMEKGKKHTPTAQEEWNVIAMACDRILFLTAIAVSIFFYKFWWNFIHSP